MATGLRGTAAQQQQQQESQQQEPHGQQPAGAALRGVFFDLDDTLIGYAEAERSALAAGCALASRLEPTISEERLAGAIYDVYRRRFEYGTPGYRELKTLPTRALRRVLTREALRDLGVSPSDALLEPLMAAYERAESEALTAFPDAVETLSALRPYLNIGLITNGPSAMQRAKLAALALEEWFDEIVVDTEFGHPKPDARIFEFAAGRVGLSRQELLFVGNSLEADIAGANAAGWISVWMNPAGAPPPAASGLTPTYTIARLSDLLTLPPVARALGGNR
jgi:haloacid dehalogenase superfamily, subfamily IA, variant 3 with third motif having DD or ED/haloacid dehalogenase superfamily, subfamily IA, variant 1 with third motif having Dx(3-4)D or Dx(3-4)E